MIVHLGLLDWLVFALFVAAVLALGLSAKLRENSMLQFLAAGRALTLPVFVATLVATWYGGILGVGEAVTDFGVGMWLLYGVPYYIFAVIYAQWFARKVRAGSQLSIPERIEARWGRKSGLAAAFAVLLLATPAALVFQAGVLLQCVTGWPMLPCLVATGFGVAALLVRGGLLADARVGVLAFALMYAGFIALDLYAWAGRPFGTILPALRAAGALHFTGGVGLVGVLNFFILGAWTLVDPAFHQRVASSASPEIGRRGVFVATLFWMLFDGLTLVAGLYALALMPVKPLNAVALFPEFGDRLLPPGLKGLFFVGMIGTVLSALAGYTLVSGATVGREVLGRLFPDAGEERLTRWSRAGMFAGVALAVLVADLVKSVVDLWYAYSGAIVGALLLPVCLAYLSRRPSRLRSADVSISIAASLVAAFAWMWQGKRTGNPELMVQWLGARFSLGTLAPALAVSAAILGVAACARGPGMRDTERHER